MTLLLFAATGVLMFGLASMNWVAIVLGVVGLGYAIHKLDRREQEENRLRWEALRQEQLARGNGKPHGNVKVVSNDG